MNEKDKISTMANSDALDPALKIATSIKPYNAAIDLVTAHAGKLSALTAQLNLLSTPTFQDSLLKAVSGVHLGLSSLNKFDSLLPRIDMLGTSPLLELSRAGTLSLTSLTSAAKILTITGSIGENYNKWYEKNLLGASVVNLAISSPIQIAAVSDSLAAILGAQTLPLFSVQSALLKATECALFAEKSLSAISMTSLGSRIGVSASVQQSLLQSMTGLSSSYCALLKSFSDNPISFSTLGPTFTREAPIEYFLSANFLEVISVEEDVTAEEEIIKNEILYECEYKLSEYLPKLDSGLYKLWKGAIEALESNNSDKIRHFTTSLRELYTHVIHLLAPDQMIKNWSKDPEDYYNSRPTRKARLQFICRNINNNPFKDFVKKDIATTLAFIDLFQSGTHKIDSDLTEEQLKVIKSKAEGSLKFLLEIHFETNN
jgi:hypothetical protein